MSAKKSLPRRLEFVYYDEDDKKVVHEVKKLALGHSAELIEAFNDLPKVLKGLVEDEATSSLFDGTHGENNEELSLVDMAVLIGNNLGPIMRVAQDAIINILHVGSGIEKQVIESLGLDEASELFLTIVKVNNLGAMQANLKNAMALLFPNREQRGEKLPKAADLMMSGSKT